MSENKKDSCLTDEDAYPSDLSPNIFSEKSKQVSLVSNKQVSTVVKLSAIECEKTTVGTTIKVLNLKLPIASSSSDKNLNKVDIVAKSTSPKSFGNIKTNVDISNKTVTKNNNSYVNENRTNVSLFEKI